MNNPAGQALLRKLFALPPAWSDVLAGLAGAMLPLAFAPFSFWPLAFLSPALLFVAWHQATPRRAAWRGFLFGLAFLGVGVSWVFVSMHRFGNMSPFLAVFATSVFVAGLSLYPALLGWLQSRLFPKQGKLHVLLVLPSLWVLFEWIRGWFLTGFPWLQLGYSQVNTWLAGYAPYLGVYGVSFVCALAAGLLFESVRSPQRFLRMTLPLGAVLLGLGWGLDRVQWVEPLGAPIHATLIQANVPLEHKWQPAMRDAILGQYLSMSQQAPRSDVIVWPEAAIPIPLDEIDPTFLASLDRLHREFRTDFLLGVVERDPATHRYYNSVISVGSHPGVYRKHHLVPFGEFPPLDPLFRWLMQRWHIPMSDFTPGVLGQTPLSAGGRMMGISVCYEDAFGEEVIRALPQASVLVNVSEDAWFGDSLAPYQRLQMARMRALESGRPMLRAANTGPSAVINHLGVVTAETRAFQSQSLSASVQPTQGATPYARFGNYPVVLLLFAIVLAAFLVGVARKKRIKTA